VAVPEQLRAGLADRYRVERELGRGGMATVYLAHDLRHDRSIALKVLHPDLAETLGPERFQREIKTAARLQHPHILAVHDSGDAAGRLWYTMPFVEGESLRDRLQRERRLPLDEAVRITSEAAQALQYAHSRGIVHRDIKPENLLLTSDGNTLVADFGIARGIVGEDQRLTSTGIVIGTPAYMSPEQAVGDRQVDARGDIYSLGCVLFEMLAGEPPFSGPTAQAILAKRLTEAVPSVRHARREVPAHVEHALARALAPEADDRYATVAEFAQALQPSSSGKTASRVRPPAGHSTSTPRRRDRTHLMGAVAAALVMAMVLALGVLFAWRRSNAGVTEGGTGKVVAVLPFENLGDSADAYFADGVGDEVRGKLSQVEGLAVIARASSNEYRHTRKPLGQIAHELGAQYLLTATVRWDKHSDGTSKVRVIPELVSITPGAPPTTKWQQGFDAALTDVFQVQADIAAQVTQALNVALGDSAEQQLATRPTQSLPAYEAFLRGEAVTQGLTTLDPALLRQAIAAYEQAVALDSTFSKAWAQLSRAHSYLYPSLSATSTTRETARRTAERALRLAPMQPEGHQALGAYYGYVLADKRRAYVEDSTALALDPRNADLLWAVGFDEHGLQRWESARGHLEQAVRLNPRSSITTHQLGLLLVCLRQYSAAERVLDHALQLMPADVLLRADRVMVELGRGDLARARAIISAAPKDVNPTALVAMFASYLELMWVLDESQQQLLLRLTPGAFDNNRATWGSLLAQTYVLRGDTTKARIYADSARLAYEQQLAATAHGPPTMVSTFYAQQRVFFGLTLAYLGRKAAAIREGQHAIVLSPISRDAFIGPYIQLQLARIYLAVAEPEKALDQLESLLKIPYYISPGWLKVDPNFTSLRGNPRFERLVNAL
jgi:serine/threonine-protein kinase